MDMLKKCAECFYKLLDVQYNVKLGRKGKLTNICLTFDRKDFHHLIGLQHLKDIPQLSQNREKIFTQIIDNEITFNQISNSDHFHLIENRFFSFIDIEKFLDSNELIFKYSPKLNPYSKIEGAFLLKNTINSNDAYIFIDDKNNADEYFCRSFFPKDKIDFTIGQTNYAMLYKEKYNLITQEKIIQYDRISPKI